MQFWDIVLNVFRATFRFDVGELFIQQFHRENLHFLMFHILTKNSVARFFNTTVLGIDLYIRNNNYRLSSKPWVLFYLYLGNICEATWSRFFSNVFHVYIYFLLGRGRNALQLPVDGKIDAFLK